MFADGTSILFAHLNTTELNSNTSTFFETIKIWLKNRYPKLNFEKNHCIDFKTGNNPATDTNIGYNNKLILNVLSTKFLGLTIDNMLPWRIHVDQLTTKLSTACHVIRSIKLFMSHKTLRLIYHFLFHTVMSYRIILWRSSCHSIQIFQMQKRVIRIIKECGNRDYCRILLKKLTVLLFMSQYVLSLFVL